MNRKHPRRIPDVTRTTTLLALALLLLLVPPLGLAGAGLALCGAYVVMLGIMHLLTRHAFPVEFEWRRLTQLTSRPLRRATSC